MFVSRNQFVVFICSIAFGGCSGLVFFTTRMLYKKLNYYLKGVLDSLIFVILGVGFILYSFYMNFPSLRLYMVLGVFLGIYLYFKSFNIILAKVVEKIYNKICKNKKGKGTKDDGVKV